MLLGRAAGERLEPVREVRGALREGPLLHRAGDVVRNGGVEGLAVVHCGKQFRGRRLGQILSDLLLSEDVVAVGLDGRVGGQGRQRRLRDVGGDRVDRMDAVVQIHRGE